MTAPRLQDVGDLNGPAQPPRYQPSDHGTGIVHIGVGAFHRAHQAVMTDDALAAHGGDWRIVGVSLRSTAVAEAMAPQNGLYTVIAHDGAGTSARVVGAIDRVIACDPAATLAALTDPAVRIVTLTVTEKGYGIKGRTRVPDPEREAISADLANPSHPRGVRGLLVEAIKQRRAAGNLPFAVLSCDNLPDNGAFVRDSVVGFAKCLDDETLAQWIAANIAFPSSMVDRITPAPTPETRAEALRLTGCDDHAAVETEHFTQWVIEDNFPSGRPKWEAGGALFVKDVAPYERMKLTMLNGSHSMMAYAGVLAGRRYVRDVMSDPDLATLVERHLKAAAGLLPPLSGIDFTRYADALVERFRNPAIAHETLQIAIDGTEKMPLRIFQPALAALDAGQDLRPFAFATAMWMRFCLRYRDDGSRYDLDDPRAEELIAALDGDPEAASNVLHNLRDLIPSRLSASEEWRGHIDDILSRALAQGCVAAIQHEAREVSARIPDPLKREKGLLQTQHD